MPSAQTPRTLGALLYQLRKDEGLSLRAMAESLEISPALLSEIESAKRFPSDRVLARISKRAKKDVSELKKFDLRVYLQDLKQLVREYPELGFALRRVMCKISDGKASVEDLLDLLSSGKFAP